MDRKIKHLEFIQGVINRLASDSFRMKGIRDDTAQRGAEGEGNLPQSATAPPDPAPVSVIGMGNHEPDILPLRHVEVTSTEECRDRTRLAFECSLVARRKNVPTVQPSESIPTNRPAWICVRS